MFCSKGTGKKLGLPHGKHERRAFYTWITVEGRSFMFVVFAVF
jgi:hypothetical protein